MKNLRLAYARVVRARRGSVVADTALGKFRRRLTPELKTLRLQLLTGDYPFAPLTPVAADKKKGSRGFRPLLVPRVQDRIVQRAVLHVVEKHLEKDVSFVNSFAFRTGNGVKQAVTRLKDELEAGATQVLLVDIIDFFSAIDADALFDDVLAKLPDRTLDLILRSLQRWEVDGLDALPEAKRRCFPAAGKGIPQGSCISPLLSNFYLRGFDQAAEIQGLTMIRYADDIAIPLSEGQNANDVLEWVRFELQKLKLDVHPLPHKKTRVGSLDDIRQPIEFLGFFLRRVDGTVLVKPSAEAIMNAKNVITECLSSESPRSLPDRYARLNFFIPAWLGSYGAVCPVESERAHLSDCVQRELVELLRKKGLLPRGRDLTRKQRRFLGMASLWGESKDREPSPS